MNWQAFGQGAATLAAGFVFLAIISVVVSRRSQAPALVSDVGKTFSQIIAAAVSPANAATNGNNAINTFTTPTNAVQAASPAYFNSMILGGG